MIKKLLIFMTLFASITMTWAQDYTDGQGVQYTIDGTNVTVSGNSEVSGNIVIPSSVTISSTVYPVTSIGETAFSNCTNLTGVTIPNSVTSIEENAFWSCTGLTAITIPNSVTSIGDAAFTGCTNLSTINFGSGLRTIGLDAFYQPIISSSQSHTAYREEVRKQSFRNLNHI